MPRATKYIKRILNFYGKGKHKYIYKGATAAKGAAKKATPVSKVRSRASRARVINRTIKPTPYDFNRANMRFGNIMKRYGSKADRVAAMDRRTNTMTRPAKLKAWEKRLMDAGFRAAAQRAAAKANKLAGIR